MKRMAAEPNHVGSPHDKANAEYTLSLFKSWGWDAHIETFEVLYPTPISETLELLGKKPYKAMLQEPPIKGDSSATAHDYALPAYVAYQGDGDVRAPLVYVNYGMPDDYKALQRLGVSVKGKIVIARYGSGWRGLKPLLAQEHGAVGCLIYSDPADDGYAVDAVYPNGPSRPPHGFQRGSVQAMPMYPGDPTTPGYGSVKGAKHLTRAEATTILKIPTLPISYADAQVFLSSLTGRTVPKNWRGALPITYRVGPSAANVHLMVKSDWSLKTLYDVIATMRGSDYPEEWVVRANHRDGWVFGASDPLSGHVALMAEAQAIGNLVKSGWRPKRTIVYASWDGEEPGLLGSTEWAETHADELRQKAVLYINTDGNGRGMLRVDGSHDFEKLVNDVAGSLIDPETNATVAARRRAQMRIAAIAPDAKPDAKVDAKIAADPTKDYPLDPMGSGSDYTVFIQHLGIPSLNVGFGGEGESGGVYHSRYDTFEHHSRFVDPGFVYDAMLAKMVGRLVLRTASSDLPLQQTRDFAERMSTYFAELKKLETNEREEAETQAKLLSDHAFELTADPTKTSGLPDAFDTVPPLQLKPLEDAITRLKTSADAYDAAFAKNSGSLPPDKRAALRAMMRDIDQTLLADVGLPMRPWFKNMIYAPGRLTGYGSKTLPGVREAIEDRRWVDADKYAVITATTINAYSDRLDKATALLNGH
ncbi:MAG: M28 family peptidase [Alphaproteobacteria bacterium]|nr:M28 family peptidase [Alphaproteobacteria bacterium]MBV9904054.1 M28 family peptidase [Alphaproteobacteria bacterium]